jgi:hypothetical protein
MSPLILAGIVTVNLSLIGYTIGFIAEQRRARVTSLVLGAFTVALAFDLVATACMTIGSKKPWYTLHGIIGFTALAAMLVAVPLLWRAGRGGPGAPVTPGLHRFLRFAYAAWALAYLAGALLAGRR